MSEINDLNSTGELSEEELQRRREIKRRKLAARQRRRKKRMKEAFIRCSILLLIVILLIVGIVKMISGIWKHFHKDKKSDKVTEQMTETDTEEVTTEAIVAQIDDSIVAKELPADREAALTILNTLGETDTDIKSICDNAAVYPDYILQNLAVNMEMKQYATDYPAKISTVFDGNFTMDIEDSSTVPLFLQYDERWGYADYGKSVIAITGCGPTCLSMAYTYLMQDGSMNPIKVADYSTEHGYMDESGDTSWALMTDGAKGLTLTSEELSLSEDIMISALESGKLIICSMKTGDFTRNGHFVLIREYKDGLFYINDPNSEARSQVGWDYNRLSTQIANMWAIGKQ